jgi:hypothetical protein
MPDEVAKDESIITERVEDVLKKWREVAESYYDAWLNDPVEFAGNHALVAVMNDFADRVQAAHNAEMKEVIDLLQKALDVCWKAECYFRWLNEQKKEGKANA